MPDDLTSKVALVGAGWLFEAGVEVAGGTPAL